MAAEILASNAALKSPEAHAAFQASWAADGSIHVVAIDFRPPSTRSARSLVLI